MKCGNPVIHHENIKFSEDHVYSWVKRWNFNPSLNCLRLIKQSTGVFAVSSRQWELWRGNSAGQVQSWFRKQTLHDIQPNVTCPAADHLHPWPATKLYCLDAWKERNTCVCVNNLSTVITWSSWTHNLPITNTTSQPLHCHHTATQTISHSIIDISVIRDTQRPWSFVEDLRRDEIRGWWWWCQL